MQKCKSEQEHKSGTEEKRMSISYDLKEQKVRKVPSRFSKEDRESFLAIAERASYEAVNCYTVMSLGCQSYITNRRFIR